jgi:hypothetical protein
MNRSRTQGLAIALATTHLSNLNATTGAAKSFASFDAGDAHIPDGNGAKNERPTAKKQIVIGDSPSIGREAQFGATTFKPVATDLAIMPAYHEGHAVAKKDHAAAKVPHHHAIGQFGGLGMNHHTNKVGVMDLMAAGAKQHGRHSSTLLRS